MKTAICIATGASLTKEDVEFVRKHHAAGVTVYAIKDAIQWAPFADVLFCADLTWWDMRQGYPQHKGQRWTSCAASKDKWPGVQHVPVFFEEVFCFPPYWPTFAVGHGGHAGFQVINLAAWHGHKRIILLGYDAQASATHGRHFYDGIEGIDHTSDSSNYAFWLNHYNKAAPIIKACGIEVINATRISAIECFKKMPINKALCMKASDH